MNDSDYLKHIGDQDRYVEELKKEIDSLRDSFHNLNVCYHEAYAEKTSLYEQLKMANARIKELEAEISCLREEDEIHDAGFTLDEAAWL
jgi:chromosome segregation ATPase